MFEFQHRKPMPVALFGATGRVGQKFVELLSDHPWFEIVALGASEKNIGKSYGEVVQWQMQKPLSPEIAKLPLQSCNEPVSAPLLFSALPASIAAPIEQKIAKSGVMVVSNARSHRYHPEVPLLVPEVNPSHLDLLSTQEFPKGGGIVTNPNCIVAPLSLALKPLQDAFGIEAVDVTTFQAVSGAGFQSALQMDIADNIIPYIADEEEKIPKELHKILDIQCPVGSRCHRVPVSDGHLMSVGITLKSKPTPQEMISCWSGFRSDVQKRQLPMAPNHPLHYFEQAGFPQPKLHRDLDKGMAASLGRLSPCPIMDYKFTLLSHNTVRGAAGGAILTAEWMLHNGYLYW